MNNPWRPEGEPEREPEPLNRWIEAGIDREEAETWRSWRYRISDAQAWRNSGVVGGLEAAQWSTAGVGPATVEQWRAAGIDATEAVKWHEFGISLEDAAEHKAAGRSPEDAWGQRNASTQSGFMSFASGGGSVSSRPRRHADLERFMQAGIAGEVVHSYVVKQWWDDTAFSWAKAGIEATDAKLWQELGLKPAEAGRLTRQGVTVFQTVRDWWRAGIPIDEVAEWIGAGLKPEEAADQRARGITAEQAATLRALRDDPT